MSDWLQQTIALAEQGRTPYCLQLGHAYMTGRDGEGSPCPQDFAEARRWLSIAHDKGVSTCTFLLGVMHEKGQGGPVDIESAIELFTIAAKRGSHLPCLHLARIYAARGADPSSRALAMKWYSRVIEFEGEVDDDDGVMAEARAYLHGRNGA